MKLLAYTENTHLITGYGGYGREILSRLHATGKYDILEVATFLKQGSESERAGPWKRIGACPPDDNERAMEVYRNDGNSRYGQLVFEEACLSHRAEVCFAYRDAWMDEHILRSPFHPFYRTAIMPTVDACFPAGTPIMTANGVANIEDIKVGDEVVSHDGTINKVLHLWKRDWEGQLVTIDACGPILPVTMTADHPVLAVKYKGQKWTHTSRKHRSVNHKYSDAEFLPASEIDVGDYLVVPKIASTNCVQNIDVLEWIGDVNYKQKDGMLTCNKTSPQLPRILQLTTNLAKFFGLFVAEGSVVRRNWNMSISMRKSTEQKELDFAQSIATNVFGCHTNRYSPNGEDTENLRFCGKLLGTFLVNTCGDNSYTRKVPPFIINADQEISIAFLEKLFLGDGSDTNSPHGYRVISYATVSRELAYQVCRMLLKLGVLASLTISKNIYNVQVLGKHCKRLADLFRWSRDDEVGFANLNNSKSWIDENSGHALVRVRRVRKSPIISKTIVYNFTVENTNSYSVGFAVHNCPSAPWWIQAYEKSEAVLTYNDWSQEVLRTQCPSMNLMGTAPPAADYEVFHIIHNKRDLRERLGIGQEDYIVGTVMRNQIRKRYPEMFSGFARFLREAPAELANKTYLYVHACWPDVGWDFPALLKEFEITHKVLFTFICFSCGTIFVGPFRDARTCCPRCNQPNATFASSQKGVSPEVLNQLYNVCDIYTQYANSEGFGIPVVEAAAAGCHTMATDYSAMSDVVRKLGGTPIEVAAHVREPETNCLRAIPCEKDWARKLTQLLSLPKLKREQLGWQARENARKHYTWESATATWERVFEHVAQIPKLAWNSPPRYVQSNLEVPEGLSDLEFVRWGLIHIAGRPDLLGSYLEARMLRDLQWEARLGFGMGGVYYHEQPFVGPTPNKQFFDREAAVKELKTMADLTNHWENRRVEVCC